MRKPNLRYRQVSLLPAVVMLVGLLVVYGLISLAFHAGLALPAPPPP